MPWGLLALALVAVSSGLFGHPGDAARPRQPRSAPMVRLVFAGDLLLGTTGTRYATDSGGLLADVRSVTAAADLSVASIRWATPSRAADASDDDARGVALDGARMLSDVGFDALALARDKGPADAPGTLATLSDAGLPVIGDGPDPVDAFAPRLLDANGVRVALLAFDATELNGSGVTGSAAATPDPPRVRDAVVAARRVADVVAVAVRRGTGDVALTGAGASDPAAKLAAWGADVVWGYGASTTGPVSASDPDGDGRPSVIATGLGDLLSDDPATEPAGSIVEVLARADGVLAYRVATLEHSAAGAQLGGWIPPAGDAVAIDDAWWTPAAPPVPARRVRPRAPANPPGTLDAMAQGDVTGDGRPEVVIAFRRPFRPTPANAIAPRSAWTDAAGLSAHVGVYRRSDMREIWVAGTLVRPVVRLAVCDGTVAVAYATLDDPAIVATGAWRWQGFGFVAPLPELDGGGTPACVDLDRDGRLEAVILERSP